MIRVKASKVIKTFFEEWEATRRIPLFWSLWLITYTVFKILDPTILPLITTPVASVLVSIIGILATIIAFFQWHKANDREEE